MLYKSRTPKGSMKDRNMRLYLLKSKISPYPKHQFPYPIDLHKKNVGVLFWKKDIKKTDSFALVKCVSLFKPEQPRLGTYKNFVHDQWREKEIII